ncbi:hypothetical protein K227x_17330 [Rubripirellula lacrimiformis]|uniref:General secretion pathway protein K n=2 Tax=Rubripirellula lacrimiformis TaxID=1930273 RepID=A0A517N895_9BACT|nr:hypothetical protein K227x_17330 [Rubripirellula lacrimiformis]
MVNRTRHHRRQGSALLICTLAATVLSMATLAIVRSQQLAIARIDATRTSLSGQATADGLMQRTIAMLRVDPTLQGQYQDTRVKGAEPWIDVQPISSSETLVQIYLYKGSKIPIVRRMVNLKSLGGGKS